MDKAAVGGLTNDHAISVQPKFSKSKGKLPSIVAVSIVDE
jgi:hypothetical protein